MRDDACGDAGGGGRPHADSGADGGSRLLCAWARQQAAVCRQWIEGAEEADALDEFTDERIHGNHAFGFKFAERHMNGPLTGAWGVEAIEGKVGRFSNAHARVPKQQEDVSGQIIAAEQFLLDD